MERDTLKKEMHRCTRCHLTRPGECTCDASTVDQHSESTKLSDESLKSPPSSHDTDIDDINIQHYGVKLSLIGDEIPPEMLSKNKFSENLSLLHTGVARRFRKDLHSKAQTAMKWIARKLPLKKGSEDTSLGVATLVPIQAAQLSAGVEPVCKSYQFLGPEGNVDIELIDKSANRYSAHFPAAGFYLWPAVGLGFLVTAAVTVKIAFDSWNQRLGLTLQHQEQWMAAGPLFEISVEPEGVIAEIHLPHIVSLPANEVDVSWFQVAHFKDEGMVLEPPSRVEPFYAVLENPSFSLMGILLRFASGTGVSVPITSLTLIYYHFHPEDIKFHLYLIPSDPLLTKAIDDEEAKFHGVRLQTSPPVDPLNFGSRYIVSSNAHLEIIPEELKLSYRSPGEIQIFSKVYAGRMKEPIILEIAEKRHKTLVWRTLVRPGKAFLKEHRRQLQARLGDLNGVLDDLQDSEVFTEEEKELVQQCPTQQRRNETLLRMVEKKGHQALGVLFQSLHRRDPYLMSYLSQQSLQQ
ncbi:caspase recruitment domain-containing protein 8-like isoform X2 [Canis aureus]